MELVNFTKLVIERADNGVILSDISSDNTVVSRHVTEIYTPAGIINFDSVANFFYQMMEYLKIHVEEEVTNRMIEMVVVKIDPEKPMLDEDGEEINYDNLDEDDEEDTDI